MWTRLRQGLRFVTRGDRMIDDIHREIDAHLQMEIDHRVAAGALPEDARRAALREFGRVDLAEEQVRDVRGLTFWDHLMQDLRFGARTLRRSPGYAFAAILTLGLGIGANSAMFSVINGTLLHPLPYRDSSRLIRIRNDAPLANRQDVGVSIAETRDLRQRLGALESFVEYHHMHFVLLNQGEPHRVNTGVVSSQYFDVFGIRPALGRTFTPSDDVLGAEPVLILSHGYWQKQFGSDPQVVGKVVQMNDHAHTIVGVLPAIGQYPNDDDVYMPTSACPSRAGAEPGSHNNHRQFSILLAFGRMKPGATVSQVSADAQVEGRSWTQQYSDRYRPSQTGFTTSAVSLDDEITRNARPMLFALVGTTVLVLLIACANVANLSLSRTLRRDRELALRSALGASRLRLVRQLLTESILVAFAGAALGLLIAWPTAKMLAAFASRFTPRAIDASIDGVVLSFTLAVALLTGLVFGVVPALAGRRTVVTSLKDGAQSGDVPARQRIRSGLVVAQVTICFALVVGAGLFLESLRRLSSVDLGYHDPEHVLTAQLHGNFSRLTTPQDFYRFETGVLDGLTETPGVIAAAMTNAVPLTSAPGAIPVTIAGQAEPTGLPPTVDANVASSDYFSVLGLSIVRGRAFNSLDTAESAPVAVINQTMEKLWNLRDPIGNEFTVPLGTNAQGQPGRTFRVIGVVADMHQYQVTQGPIAQFYFPTLQAGGNYGPSLLIRTHGDPFSVTNALKSVVHKMDDATPVEDIETLEELRRGQLQSPMLTTALLAIFAALALVITLAGVGAVIATSVSQRTREFGVRMALGASRSSVLSMVLRQALWLLVAGLALGAAGAIAFSRVLAQYLFNTRPTEPAVYVAVAGFVLLAGTIACLAPARRATRVDPLRALRSE
jgi:putative ABC transport system permease protein